MRYYDMVKCKRRSMRMYKEKFARLIDIDLEMYERFENGELIPKPIFDAIVYGVDKLVKSYSWEEQLEINIVANALSLRCRESDADKRKALNYIIISAAKLDLEVSRQNLESEAS